MSEITQVAKDALNNTATLKIAHLVAIELPGTEGVFTYMTDYFKDVVYNGKTYLSGSLKSVGNVKQTKAFNTFNLPVKVSGAVQAELDRALNSESFLNRRIIIHRAFFQGTGDILPIYSDGSSVKYFEGIISTLSIADNISTTGLGSSVITWNCASKMSDFKEVNGRITDDVSHRGLVTINGKLQPSAAAKRLDYQQDKGFAHANNSIKVLASYQTKEKRYKMSSKRSGGIGGLLGGKSYNMEEYWADVTREINLDINLTAKYIPVIYGVQKTPGIPVFVDTLKDNPDELWAVFAFCEGEIDGFLDFYFDDKPIICVDDKEDPEKRVCLGSKKYRGDTLSLADHKISETSTHGANYVFNDGKGDIEFWTFHGKSGQKACKVLVDLASNSKFGLQTQGDTEYWDDDFKLLDTAYAVFKIDLNQERTNIPQISAEVQGRKVRVYKEDGSFTQNSTSLNFAWQTLDYAKNDIFGAGLSLDIININSFLKCAKLMDIVDTSYDTSWVPYWRYLGWEDNTGEHRQIMQGSPILDTSGTVYKNVSSLLSQFDASLNIVSGIYNLSIEAERPAVADIDFGDLVAGRLDIHDTTNKEKYNSIQAAIIDPATGWNTNTITFYNSDYKAKDNNVESKANAVFPYITNYYTARSRAERVLNKSRYTKRMVFKLPFYFLYLAPNDPITLTVPNRYNWNKKKLMVEDLEWTPDGKVKVTAREYESGVFLNSEQVDHSGNQLPDITVDVLPPTDVRYSPDIEDKLIGLNGNLNWKISSTRGVAYYTVRRSGKLDAYVVTVTGEEPVGARVGLDLYSLPKGNYTFEIKAVNAAGVSSKATVFTVDINATKNLSNVPNFKVLNLLQGSSLVFVGRDLELAWDNIPEYAQVAGLAYNIEILDTSDNVLRSVTVTNALLFTYTLAMNKEDYSAASGSLGLNRTLKARIKAVGGNNEASVQWTYV